MNLRTSSRRWHPRLFLAFHAILAGLTVPLHAEERLWDKEPSLWEEARTFKIVRPLSAKFGWEGPAGTRNPTVAVPPPGPEFAGPLGQGVNISNSRVHSSLWGTPDRLVISIGKTDVFNRAKTGFTRGKKPVGQILLRAGDFTGVEQPQVSTSIHDGVHRLAYTKNSTTADVEVLLSDKETNVFAIRARYNGLIQMPAVRLYRHKDTLGDLPNPESGDGDGFFWIRQSFEPEKTFPDGFDYYLVGRIAGTTELKPEHTAMEIGLGAAVPARDDSAPGTAVTAIVPETGTRNLLIYVTVVTRAESSDPLGEAKSRLLAAEKKGFDGLREQNTKIYSEWFDAREHGRIFTGDFADARNVILPFLYQSAFQFRHTYNSNPDPSRYESDSSSNGLECDDVNWSGLPCFKEELYTGDFVAGRDETVGEYYVKLFNFWRPAWEEKAKSMGHQGLCVIRGYVPPIKPDVYSSPDGHAITGKDWASSVWAFKSVWDMYDYGGRDEQFLREKVYPSLRGIADFFASLVVKGEDGFYHIESGQVREEETGRDPIDCVGAAKWAFRTAIQASSILVTDADKRKIWQERLDGMKPYDIIPNSENQPIFASLTNNGKPVVAGTGGSHFLVNVADEINLESPPVLRATAIRSLLHNSGHPANRQVEYLLGESRDTLVMPVNYPWIHMFAHPAWLMYYAQHSGEGDFSRRLQLDTKARKTIACWLEPERLCNSRSGTIFLFPATPTGMDVAFKDFQARGGFLVSGEMKGGNIVHASIKARRAGPCAVMNPWPGKTLRIVRESDGSTINTEKSGEKYRFNSKPGESYLLKL